MLLIKPIRYKQKRPEITAPQPPPTPGPVVVNALADFETLVLTVFFDQDIFIDNYDGDAITVRSAETQRIYSGANGVQSVSANTMLIHLLETGAESVDVSTLSATSITGVKSVETNEPWAGVDAYPLK